MSTLYRLVKKDKPEIYDLDKGDWFYICGGPEYVIFKMTDLWTVDSLSEFVFSALHAVRWHCRTIAEDILNWAGDDELTMVPDTEDYLDVTRKRFGFDSSQHQIVRDRYTVFGEKE